MFQKAAACSKWNDFPWSCLIVTHSWWNWVFLTSTYIISKVKEHWNLFNCYYFKENLSSSCLTWISNFHRILSKKRSDITDPIFCLRQRNDETFSYHQYFLHYIFCFFVLPIQCSNMIRKVLLVIIRLMTIDNNWRSVWATVVSMNDKIAKYQEPHQ